MVIAFIIIIIREHTLPIHVPIHLMTNLRQGRRKLIKVHGLEGGSYSLQWRIRGGGVGGLNPPQRCVFGLSVYENSCGPGP